MTHLPECNYTPEYFVPEDNILWRGKPCICENLRACEQRVSAKKDEIIGLTAFHSYRKGYNDALEEAEEAINKAPTTSNLMITLQDVWAAIRGLQEEK